MNPYNPYFYNQYYQPNNNYLAPQMNRLNNLEQQQYQQQYQNNYVQQQMPQMPQQPMLQGKVVESYDVFKAIDAPLDGSTTYFPQVDGSVIYTKQLGMDGNPKINVYELKNPNATVVQQNINNIQKEDIEKLYQDISELKKCVSTVREGMNNILDMFDELKSEMVKKPLPAKGVK